MKKAFTLIELLLVISIIALLTSVILTNLRNSKLKAESSSVASSLIQIRNSAELFRSDNGGYANVPDGFNVASEGCNASGPSFGFFESQEVNNILKYIIQNTPGRVNTNIICYVSKNSWVVAVKVHNDTLSQTVAFQILNKLGLVAKAEMYGILTMNEEGQIKVFNDNDNFLFRWYTVATFSNDTNKFVIDTPSEPEPEPLTATCNLSGSAKVRVGSSVTVTANAAGGEGNYTYRWYLNGRPGSTSSTASIRIMQTGTNTLYVRVTSGQDIINATCTNIIGT